jgi:hypothetical protein
MAHTDPETFHGTVAQIRIIWHAHLGRVWVPWVVAAITSSINAQS